MASCREHRAESPAEEVQPLEGHCPPSEGVMGVVYTRLAAGQDVDSDIYQPRGVGALPQGPGLWVLTILSAPAGFLEILAGFLEPSGFHLGKPRRGFPGLQLPPPLPSLSYLKHHQVLRKET